MVTQKDSNISQEQKTKEVVIKPADFAAALVKFDIHLDISEKDTEAYAAAAFAIIKNANPYLAEVYKHRGKLALTKEYIAARRADELVYTINYALNPDYNKNQKSLITRKTIKEYASKGTASNVDKYIPEDWLTPEQLAKFEEQPVMAGPEAPLEGHKADALQDSYHISEGLEFLVASKTISDDDLEKISNDLANIKEEVISLIEAYYNSEKEHTEQLKAKLKDAEERLDNLDRYLGKIWRLKNNK